MYSAKFPPGFCYEKKGVQLEDDLCGGLPDYSEVSQIVACILSIREQYCPITNYDISGRASRGLFIGVPDSGIELYSFLQCSGIYEASMCTYDPQRRSSVSRNCYLWGCESRVSLTSFTLMDALERWYPTHAVMTPVYLDLRYSNSTLQIVVDDGHSFSVRGVDGKTILEKCFEVRCPFVCLRIHKNNLGIVKDYGFQLRGFQTTELESEDVLLFSWHDG